MSFLSRQKLFSFFCVFFLFNFFFFSETDISYYIFLLFSVFLLFYKKHFPLKKRVDKRIVLSILLFLVFSTLSTFFSTAISVSIFSLTRYILLFSFFLVFIGFDFTEDTKKTFYKVLFFLGIFFATQAFVFFVFPNLGLMIPGMNLFFSSYGHNHIGTLFLMLAPIGMFLFLEDKKPIFLFLTFLFYFLIIFSFGRVVIFLAILQLIYFIYFLFKKRADKRIIRFFGLLASLMSVILLIYFYSNNLPFCSIDDFTYKKQICKSDFSINLRSFYWKQAVLGFTDKPIFGYGPGTFSNVSYKYRQIKELRTSYVHNDYLQIFVEGGFFSGVFFCLIFIFLLKKVPVLRIVHNSKIFIYLSITSFILDIFFDYNFNFFFLTTIFLMISALFYENKGNKDLLSVKWLQILTNLLLFIVILISSFYIFIDTLIFLKREQLAYKIAPFFHWHSLIFLQNKDIPLEDKLKNHDLYLYSPTIYVTINRYFNDQERVKNELEFWEKDPWLMVESLVPRYFYLKKDTDMLLVVMSKIETFFNKQNKEVFFQKESVGTFQKTYWAKAYVYLAEEKQKVGDLNSVAHFLNLAHYFDPWSISEKSTLFDLILKEETDLEKVKYFLSQLSSIPVEYWGDNRESLASLYFELITKDSALIEQQDDLLKSFVENMIALAPWSSNWLVTEYFSQYKYCFDQEPVNATCQINNYIFNDVCKLIFEGKYGLDYADYFFFENCKNQQSFIFKSKD